MAKTNNSIAIFSLTDAGKLLGDSLCRQIANCTHLHKPDSFSKAAKSAFTDGEQCIFICSTGIVIRTLAPVIKDKYSDPAVVVLDDSGKYVIPLLSNHEGGAGLLAARVAAVTAGELVNTTATDYSQPVYCIGFGSDRGCPIEMLDTLYQQALDCIPEGVGLSAMASIDLKQNEQAMVQLAARQNLPFTCFPAAVLRLVEDQLSTRSEVVFNEVGCYGVAEAAALVAASAITGNPAELVLTKQKNARGTVSVARSYR